MNRITLTFSRKKLFFTQKSEVAVAHNLSVRCSLRTVGMTEGFAPRRGPGGAGVCPGPPTMEPLRPKKLGRGPENRGINATSCQERPRHGHGDWGRASIGGRLCLRGRWGRGRCQRLRGSVVGQHGPDPRAHPGERLWQHGQCGGVAQPRGWQHMRQRSERWRRRCRKQRLRNHPR